jgi:hypothetical protein
MSTCPIGGGGWPPCFFERVCSFTTLIQSKLQQHPQWRIPAGHGLRLQPGLAATAITAYRQASLRLRRWSVCRRGKLASSLAVFGGASAHDLDPARGAMGSALRGDWWRPAGCVAASAGTEEPVKTVLHSSADLGTAPIVLPIFSC